MIKARKYVVKNHFDGVPKREDFEIVEYELPPIQEGEILVKTEWVSVDPYQRAYNIKFPVPYDQFSFQVGLIQDSKNPKFPIGSRVVTHKGWCDYFIINLNQNDNFLDDTVYLIPDLKGLPNSTALGAAGFSGASAYFGFLEICKPKAGETVVVTGAAGSVGSIVGQIAKIKGCRVIGFAGSDEKVNWLEKDLGFDAAFNYKTVDVKKALQQAAPDGIDCYFDNVGGKISSIIMSQMNNFGRVSVCGCISVYNENMTNLPNAPVVQLDIVTKQLKVEGFLITRWVNQVFEAHNKIVEWIKSGHIKTREHVTKGFDNIYDAFVGMLAGENIGKSLVQI